MSPLVRLRLMVADRALVALGERVEIGQPVLERSREAAIVDVPDGPALANLAPGDLVDVGALEPQGGGRNAPRPGDRVRLLYRGPDGRVRLAVGRQPLIVTAPVDGTVEALTAGGIDLRADGLGLPVSVGWGLPVHGPLIIGVPGPEAELRASGVDITAAGAILVAGARLDIEALTRARAIGVAGIVAGGIVGRELGQLDASDVRQRAALHAHAPFALVTLDGYGRRPIPGPTWDLLQAAAGRTVGLLPESRWLVISGELESLMPEKPRSPGSVRIAAGEGIGREGRLVGLTGPARRPGGLYQSSGFVEDTTATDPADRRRVVPLADLERFG